MKRIGDALVQAFEHIIEAPEVQHTLARAGMNEWALIFAYATAAEALDGIEDFKIMTARLPSGSPRLAELTRDFTDGDRRTLRTPDMLTIPVIMLFCSDDTYAVGRAVRPSAHSEGSGMGGLS